MIGHNFANEVRHFVNVYVPDRVERIIRTAIKDCLTDANRPVTEGGLMPFDTGYLAGSLAIGLNGAPRRVHVIRSWTAWQSALSRWRLGMPLVAEWTAPYAVHVEYGANGIRGAAFMRLATQKWQWYVSEAERKVGQ